MILDRTLIFLSYGHFFYKRNAMERKTVFILSIISLLALSDQRSRAPTKEIVRENLRSTCLGHP